ncbi:hypothetical protein [Caballeronia sp. Lep1P3]|uniref:hypothetical protein n=1 Tax=Caballeronia sp. Lep1P3 TaxID=2878150 RepID=UPI001FD13C67|nr:hypothetical protein [Caballeronia sp. Lep1P3]
MQLSHEDDLLRDHPAIFRKLRPRFSDGERFECGAGWKAIISNLATDLARIALEADVEPPAIVMVKEKVGSLRVYLERPTSEIFEPAIDAAHDQSLVICELCGAPGARVESAHYAQVRCGRCAGASREQEPALAYRRPRSDD